jgi:pilus assembly protein CpaF
MFTIIVNEKGGKKSRLEFDEETVTIGRVQGNQVVLPRGNVSKRHARLEVRGGEHYLTDLGSTNGTYINGRRISEPAKVEPGDKIYVGEFILGLEVSEVSSAGAELSRPPRVYRSETVEPVAPSAAPRAAPPGSRAGAPRPGAAAPTTRQPSVERAPAPKRPRPSAPRPRVVSRPAPRQTATELDEDVQALIEATSRQVKRVDPANLPVELDEGTAGKVRLVLQDLVRELENRGAIGPSRSGGSLLENTFRCVVHLGPLGGWLDDPEIAEIRIVRHDTALLLREGAWVEASSGWTGAEDLFVSLRCLGAGLASRDELGGRGLERYRLEDGALVLADPVATPGGGPSAVIYKDLGLRVSEPPLGDPVCRASARSILEEAVARRGRIAVVGPAAPLRLAAVADIARLLPVESYVVGVQDAPLVDLSGARRTTLIAGADSEPGPGLPALIPRAADRDPDWLVICGTRPGDLPAVLAQAAFRRGVVAELPIGGSDAGVVELAAALAAAGTPLGADEAGRLLSAGFDAVALVGRGPDGRPAVEKVASP